jgi:molybdenum cofactor guanylyltransferase
MSGSSHSPLDPVSHSLQVGGIILAGGKSSRMGSEKGLVDFQGKPMVAWIIAALEVFTKDILIVAHNADYERFGYEVVPDDVRDRGPLAGLVTGLRQARHDLNLVVSCDVPLVHPQLLRWLLESYEDEAAAVFTLDDRIQPLVGLYHRKALPTLERLLAHGQLKLRIALDELQAAVLDPVRSLPGFDADWLRNFNSRAEIDAYLQGL